MAIIKEYRCLAHGPFDGKEAVCPSGCSTVIREFRSAPALKSARTKGTDATLERMAAQFGLTDMSNRNGSVGASQKQQSMADQFKPVWGDMPKGNIYEVGRGEVQRDGSAGGATAALSGIGVAPPGEGEVSVLDMAKKMPKLRPNVAGSYGTPAQLDEMIAK